MPKIECNEVESVMLGLGMDNDKALSDKIQALQKRHALIEKRRKIVEKRSRTVAQQISMAQQHRRANTGSFGVVIKAHGLTPPTGQPPRLEFNERTGLATLSWDDEKPKREDPNPIMAALEAEVVKLDPDGAVLVGADVQAAAESKDPVAELKAIFAKKSTPDLKVLNGAAK